MLDGMILIAATAIAFSWARPVLESGRDFSGDRWLLLVPIFLVPWTLAALALRWRRPRPDLRELMRQPGSAALVAATLMIGFATLFVLIGSTLRLVSGETAASRWGPITPANYYPIWWRPLNFHLRRMTGAAVAAAWVQLVLSGLRRPESGWIDRLGRVLGACWIAAFMLSCEYLSRTHFY